MSTALDAFLRTHGVATHRKTGAGHRYQWMAYFEKITMKDGAVRSFIDLTHEYSMAKLEARGKFSEGDTEEEACKVLAKRNGIPWPADEPKRKAKQ